MRWPFHRNTTPSPDTGVRAGVGGGESGAGSAEVRAGWRELPPLQRSTEDLAPIAAAASFRESLAAHQDPRFLAPLGHSLVVDAPAGEVSGYATPVSEVAPKVSFPHPPSADISGTAAGSAPVGLQRAVDGGSSSSVPRAYSLPAATTFFASELPAVEPRPVPASPALTAPVPVTTVPVSSLPVVQTSPDPVASTSVPTVPSVPSAPPAPSAAVVSRSVESHDHSHNDHTQHDHTEHEHAADEQTHAGQGGEVVGAPVREMPLVGLSEPLGQSPFVSALGGPEPGPSVQRAAEAEPVVKRAAEAELVVHRVAEVGPVAQRAVEVQREVPEASVNANSNPVAHRWLQAEFAVQRAAESGGVVSGGLVSGGSVAGGNVADGNLSGGSGDWAAASAPAMPVAVGPDSVADAAVAQRALDGVLPVHQRTVNGGEPVAPEVQRSGVDEPSHGTRGEVGLVGQREMAVQRAVVEAESMGREAAAEGHPARIVGVGPVVQRVGGGADGVQQAAEGSAQVQRAVEGATGMAGSVKQGRVEVVQRSIVGGGAAAAHGAGSERIVQRAVDVGPMVARDVAGPAELLWPPRGGVDEGETAPLSSAKPLTVPEVQRPVSVPVGSTSPAVQRVVYGHPGLGSPARPPRATPQAPSIQTAPAPQEAQVPASVGQGNADGEVLSWSLGDSFHAGEPAKPAVQRAEIVRSVSLQQMFSGHAMTAPAEADHAVQRDGAPQEAPAVQTAEPAPAPAAAPVPAPAAGAAAGGGAKTVSAAEVEELAKRLYEPLTAKLRAELWLDRERAGRVTDRW
ncbi:hypothetical protein EV648_109327 [Kribbella sp. VKM Ac-2568]|nr:hypothetical protein EV648_109327 [Kribbella sp. VKM Ac-2568]